MNEEIRVQCVPSCERRGMTSGATQLAALKEAGYKVTVSHQRRYEAVPSPHGWIPAAVQSHRIIPTGGITRVEIFWPDKPEEVLATGVAFCSNRDNYNRKLGLTIAIGRALKALGWRE